MVNENIMQNIFDRVNDSSESYWLIFIHMEEVNFGSRDFEGR